MTSLSGSLSDINGNFSDFTTSGGASQSDTAKTNVTTVRNQVRDIPNTVSPYKLTLTYNIPINAPTTTLLSPFATVLGDHSNTSSLVGGLYTVINNISLMITDIRNNATSFSGSFSGVGATLGPIQDAIKSISDSISNLDSSMGGFLGYVNTAGTNGNMGLQVYYGVLIGFSFLSLLGTLLTVCCDKYGCRNLIYFACIVLFFVGLIGALIATLFSVFIPVLTWTCSYIDVAISTQAGFNGISIVIQPTSEPPSDHLWPTNSLPVCPSGTEASSDQSQAEAP